MTYNVFGGTLNPTLLLLVLSVCTRKQEGYGYRQRNSCVSFSNQPKAHFGFPWVRPWDNRGKCYMSTDILGL